MKMLEPSREKRVIDFNPDDWGLLSTEIAWTNLHCPVCKQYNSNSFLFDVKPNREEYEGQCEKCGVKIKIRIPKEANNKLYNYFQKRIRELTRRAEISRKYRYEIFIEKNTNTRHWKDYEYSFSADKNYGSHSGSSGWAKDRQDLLNQLKGIIAGWEGYDSIVERMGDRVTWKNLYFEDQTKTIDLKEIASPDINWASFIRI